MLISDYFVTAVAPDLLVLSTYDPWFVGLSILIAIAFSALGLHVGDIARSWDDALPRAAALASGALAMGVGVWAMHIVGMLALRLCAPVSYDPLITALSVIPSLAASWVALYLLGRPVVTPRLLLMGGTLMGLGIGSMHYGGMSAMRMAPLLRYDPWWFSLSIVAAVGLAVLALWIRHYAAARMQAKWQALWWSALVMGSAIASMHYMGMLAARFVGEAKSVTPLPPLDAGVLIVQILFGISVLALAVLGANTWMRMRQLVQDTSEARAALTAMVNGLAEAVLTFDARSHVQRANPALLSLLGAEESTVCGRPVVKVLPEIVDLSLSAHFADAGACTEALHASGERIPVQVRVAEYWVGSECMHVASLRDLRGEQRLREAEAAQQVAERANQAKSEFLSSMSHELRTPMNVILGFAQVLEQDDRLDAEQLDNLHEISKAGRHLLELINEVLDLAKIESGRINLSMEGLALASLFDECRSMIAPLAAPHGLHLDVQPPADLAVLADRGRLKQVLLNLLSNAVKYNRPGGTIVLTAERMPDARIRLAVRDGGKGIAPDRMAELFQPFNRLDAEASQIEGTGIGLSISKRLIEMMGGDIGVESEVGVGSTFWLVLNASKAVKVGAGGTAAADGQTAECEPAERADILCIDDNPANLKLFSQILGKQPGLHLRTAHVPEQGIEMALTCRPDLILLDINMPGLSGYDVLEILHSDPKLRSVPIVAVTANAMPADIERGKAAGFADYVTKPIMVEPFLASVRQHLAFSRQTNTAPAP